MGEELVRCGFYIQPLVQGCNCHFEVQLYHDPLNPVEGSAVKSAFERVTKLLFDLGGFFSRPYGTWADEAFERVTPENVNVLRKVKNIFDPNHVLKPGALCFRKESG
ncbi:MAG: FAD dependent oxidoreductase [Promethearchaeota archaeon CR_4]|nr:MAG: FAD dependent oxidoreductase [Candidatus Lokiarchaeota archaeon CR_4]